MRSRLVWTMIAVATAAFAAPVGASAAAGPALTVDAAAGRHAISPLIYGWNYVDPSFGAEIAVPVDRRGGNSADTVNWQTGFENHSNDYFFEDIPWCYQSLGCDTADASHAYRDQVDGDRAIGAKTIIDVPLLGYVAAGAGNPGHYDHPLLCSFRISVLGAQADHDPFDTDCGNGRKPIPNQNQWITNVQQLSTADPAVTPASNAAYQGAWIADLVVRYQTAANGGVAFYELGNEPGLWADTHHDWHPAPTTALELLDKSQDLAVEIKQRDSTASVIGPAEWGWLNYFCSAKDGGCGPDGPAQMAGSDYETYGPMMEAYLKRFKDYADARNGTRVLDYLDLHYYAQGGDTTDITRSLWDPTYPDPSWIATLGDGHPEIYLIPRMRQWIAADYPGTKTSLSEYDLALDPNHNGSGNPPVDNLIQADVLGIFAREQLDMATLWPQVSNDNYQDAFRVYRNYDGAHSRFGDTYVSSASGDQGQLAVYGAQRSGDGALTLVVINKTAGELTSSLTLSGFAPAATAKAYRWTGVGTLGAIGDQPVSASGFSATYPAQSITVFTIPAAGSGTAGNPLVPPGPGGLPGTTGTTTPTGTTPGTVTTTVTRCVVPKLLRLTLRAAKRKLRRAHCRLGRVTKRASQKRKGTVIAQKPRARRRLKAGAKVAVVLSRGR